MSGKSHILLQDYLPRCWKFWWRHGSLFEWSYFWKHWSIKMLFQFFMDGNKLFIYLLECWYFELGQLFKPLQIHSFLLWNFVFWIKVITTLALGSQPRQGLARLRAKRKPGSEGKCEGMNPHTPKGTSTLGVWSPDGFPKLQRAIAGVKTHWIEKLFVLLESYWNLDV